MMKDLLPLEQRLETYRRFAEEALRQATQTRDLRARTNLLRIAATWQSLASDIEKMAPGLDNNKRYDQDIV